MHISQVPAISQLGLQQAIVPIKLPLNRKVRLDPGHFAQRLDVHWLESFMEHLRCAISENVSVVFERGAGNDGHVAFVALLDNAEDSIDVCRQNADGFGLSEYVFDRVPVEDFGHSQEPFLELGVKHLTCVN